MNQNGYNPQGVPGYGFQNNDPQGGYPAGDQPYQPVQQGYPAGQQRYFQPRNNEAEQSSYSAYQPQAAQGYGYQNTAYQNPGVYASSAIQQPYGTPQQVYPNAQPAYTQVTGYPPQTVQGYPQAGQGYPPQAQQGAAYPYQGQAAGTMTGGYNPAGQTGAGYGIPPLGGGQTGSFIPPTPYSPGYQTPGYQNPNAPMQGYSPYSQMGRNQPTAGKQTEYSQQIPLNGGGYVPPRVPVRRAGFRLKDLHLFLAGGTLLILFALGMLIPSTILKILFLLLAAGTTVFLWVKPVTEPNRRLCYTIIAAVLCLATIATIAFSAPGKTNGGESGNGGGTPEKTENPQNLTVSVVDVTARPASPETTDTPEPEDTTLLARIVEFFDLWSKNRQDDMLALCAPSWQSKLENPRTKLFSILANRKPTKMSWESISGTAADTSRKVTVVVEIDRNDGKPVQTYRMTVLMLKENNEWFVQPDSLASYEKTETPDPNETPTVSPTPTAAIYPNTALYYNPNGGEYYHLDPYCRNVSKKLTPLAGQFYYSQVNDPEYANLKPCNVCGAPLREQGP